MKQMFKLGLILALYTGVACVALALVNNFTAGAIEKAAQEKLNKGLRLVFSEADEFIQSDAEFISSVEGVTIDAVYLGKKNGKINGAIVKASGSTYDKATMLIGLTTDKKITSISFLSLSDTPGYGQKATEPAFSNQFSGKPCEDDFIIGNDIDAISGATITTKGVINIIKSSIQNGLEAIENGGEK